MNTEALSLIYQRLPRSGKIIRNYEDMKVIGNKMHEVCSAYAKVVYLVSLVISKTGYTPPFLII